MVLDHLQRRHFPDLALLRLVFVHPFRPFHLLLRLLPFLPFLCCNLVYPRVSPPHHGHIATLQLLSETLPLHLRLRRALSQLLLPRPRLPFPHAAHEFLTNGVRLLRRRFRQSRNNCRRLSPTVTIFFASPDSPAALLTLLAPPLLLILLDEAVARLWAQLVHKLFVVDVAIPVQIGRLQIINDVIRREARGGYVEPPERSTQLAP